MEMLPCTVKRPTPRSAETRPLSTGLAKLQASSRARNFEDVGTRNSTRNSTQKLCNRLIQFQRPRPRSHRRAYRRLLPGQRVGIAFALVCMISDGVDAPDVPVGVPEHLHFLFHPPLLGVARTPCPRQSKPPLSWRVAYCGEGITSCRGWKDVLDFFNALQSGAGDARSDDTLGIREEVANWLNTRTPTPSPVLETDSRSNRGLQHDLTGRLLCPIEWNWDNPEVRAKIRACEPEYDLAGSPFLRALYAFERGDPAKVWDGYLMSGLLVRTYRYIFTSPQSAKGGLVEESTDLVNMTIIFRPSSTKKSKRKDVSRTTLVHNQVTPRSIAYAAVQLVFALTDAGSWIDIEQSPHGFNNLYYFIVDFFEDPVNDLAKAHGTSLLRWWNLQVFSSPTGRRVGSAPRTTSRSKQVLLAQWTALAAEKARADGTATAGAGISPEEEQNGASTPYIHYNTPCQKLHEYMLYNMIQIWSRHRD
ncbi:hypothetical protein LshimejAT787_0803350 [Lyophyllum shimeji]|uniref:Uncharacterized protein n=1 Tax=Lyophyllum shimeji TaxID=47721 RepID=A0A9P3UMI2_LYOSH|nr:hypothetical protein LshimejAT787_0803350 [Lyophyllum shimeji]